MDTYKSLMCLSCKDDIISGQDIAIPIIYKEPGSKEEDLIVCICWYCHNEMGSSLARKEAIEAIICARVTRLRYDDENKSFIP